ncbi:hypothetical protein F7096_22490, partial [Dickeya dianthicola]|uniref:hypothetical protein n=1 Tax=Dickeya dianthicola TaxID=204039 RepID=UPI0018E040C5
DVQTLSAGGLSNSGTLSAGGDGRLTGRALDNAGTLSTGGALMLTADDIGNGGRVESRTLSLTGDRLDNGGTLLATNDVTLNLTQGYTGGAGSQVRGNGAVTLTADRVTQQGDIGGERL